MHRLLCWFQFERLFVKIWDLRRADGLCSPYKTQSRESRLERLDQIINQSHWLGGLASIPSPSRRGQPAVRGRASTATGRRWMVRLSEEVAVFEVEEDLAIASPVNCRPLQFERTCSRVLSSLP